ncbi:MAG TPA: hypothetical protein DCE47_16340, partial [Planctomycetaceae bacterium]|nr:hypothetical protein [Planctomycetaceae bacterium]
MLGLATMAVLRSGVPASRVSRSLLRLLNGFDGLLVILAMPFGVLPRSPVVRWLQFGLAHAAIYWLASQSSRLDFALPALVIGWVGILAVGRAWVRNEKRRSDIARKLLEEADPDRYPDLRLLALVSALQIFVVFPMFFWRLSDEPMAGQEHVVGLFQVAAETPWWHWPLYTLRECVLPFIDTDEVKSVLATGVSSGPNVLREVVPGIDATPDDLVQGLRLTLEWVLLTGLLRIFAIRRTIREVVVDAALRNDNEMAVRLGLRAVRPLLRQLENPAADVQIAAADALGEIGDRRATVHLIRLFTGPASWPVRQAAASALGQVGDPQAVPPLLASLDDERVEAACLRNTVARSLGQFGRPEAVPRLIRQLDRFQDDITLRLQWAARVLFPPSSRYEIEYEQPVRDPESGKPLLGSDGRPLGTSKSVRSGRVHDVGIDPKSGKGPFIQLYNEKFSRTPFRNLSLMRIRDLESLDDRGDLSGPDVRAAHEFIRDGLHGFFRDDQVIEAIGRIGDRQAAQVLADHIRGVDELPVIGWLGKGDSEVEREQVESYREHAILALQRIGDPASAEVLLEVLRGEYSESLKQRAALALVHLPGGREQLADWLSDVPEGIRSGIEDVIDKWWTRLDRDIDATDNQVIVVKPVAELGPGFEADSRSLSGRQVPFEIRIDRETIRVVEIIGEHRLRVIRGTNGPGRPHLAGEDVWSVDPTEARGQPAVRRGRGLGHLLRTAMLLVLVSVLGVLVARKVMPTSEAGPPPIGKAVDREIDRVHQVISDVLPPGTDVNSTLFQTILFGVPATLVLLLLVVGRRQSSEVSETSPRILQPPTFEPEPDLGIESGIDPEPELEPEPEPEPEP